MIARPESPIDDQTNPAGPSAVDETGGADDVRQHAGRGRGQRPPITPADLTMYSVITGRAPSSEERERALTWGEAEATEGQESGPMGSASMRIVPDSFPLRPWHPSAISLRVREIWFNGITLKTARPQISHFLRRLSVAIQEGRRRVAKVSRAA